MKMIKKRKINDKGRVTIPSIMLEGIDAKIGDEINIEYDNKQIVITNPKTENQRIKTKREIERKLHNLNELVKEGFEDERLFGNIDMLEWVLDVEREKFDYLNDYDDAEVEKENVSLEKEGE